MRLLAVAVLVASGWGCGQPRPTLSGGKSVQHWVETLKTSPDPRARKEAAFKLGNVGPTDPATCPALVAALKDRQAVVRCEAIVALVKFDPIPPEAVAALTGLQKQDPDAKVRTYADRTLKKLPGKLEGK